MKEFSKDFQGAELKSTSGDVGVLAPVQVQGNYVHINHTEELIHLI